MVSIPPIDKIAPTPPAAPPTRAATPRRPNNAPAAPTWRYSHTAGWHEGGHPLPPATDDWTDLTTWLASGGFDLMDEVETEHGSIGLSLFERESVGDWLIGVDLPHITRLVYAPDLPSALALLREVMPVVEAAGRLGAANEAREERAKIRRRGGIYNAAKRCMEIPR